MNDRYIFHLSFPVLNLQEAKEFYIDTLGAKLGRENEEWLDILIWGHQITLQLLPEQVLPSDKQGKRHFGVILPWGKFDQLVEKINLKKKDFYKEPQILYQGTEDEQVKLYLRDPSFNVIEIKSYKNFDSTLNQKQGAYNYQG